MWNITFYIDHRGKSPPIEFIETLPIAEQAKVRNIIRLLREFGPRLGMPHAKHVQGKLWELRPGGIRLFYFAFIEKQFVILHGYPKQSNKAPEREIAIAVNGCKNYWMKYEMTRKNLPRFEDWEVEKLKDPEFQAAAETLEPGYQVARLRVMRGLTQAQLAEMVGTRQPSIARLENGTSMPSLTFLNKVATALDAKIQVRIVAQ